MKKITRANLRGKPLDKECYRANRTTNEYGKDDNRVFCYGLYAEFSDDVIDEKCLKCKAYVGNAEPLNKEEPRDLEMEVYEELCVGCSDEKICHEECEYCVQFEERLEEKENEE